MRHTLNLPRNLRDILAANRNKPGLNDFRRDDEHFSAWLEGHLKDQKLDVEYINYIDAIAYTSGCTKLCVIVSLAEYYYGWKSDE